MQISAPTVPTVSWLRPAEVPTGSYWVHDEHFPDPLTPLYGDFGPGNLSDDADLVELATPVPTKQRIVVDGYLYTGTLSHPEPPTPERIAAFEDSLRQRRDRDVVSRWFAETRPALDERQRVLGQLRLTEMDDATLLNHIRALASDTRAAHRAHALNVRAISLLTRHLDQFCADHFGLAGRQQQELLAGSSAATGDAVAAMETLARHVQANPGVRAALDADGAGTDRQIQALLGPYVARFGHRLLQPDFVEPTLAERPEVLVQLLREAVARLDAGAGQAPESARRRASELADGLRARLSAAGDRAEFDTLLAEARAVHGIREDDQALLATLRGFLRYALLEAGRRLSARGTLDRAESVWYLRRPELEVALAGNRPALADGRLERLGAVAHERQAEHRRQCARTPAPTFGTPPRPVAWPVLSTSARRAIEALAAWTVTAPEMPAALPATLSEVMRGMGAARGTYTGPARIVHGPQGFARVQPGDVLVCKISNPAWTIIFGRIGAIVTEVGSVLSHPAIAAREFGIPGVVAVAGATTRIADGQIVCVDGEAGTVTLT